MQHGVFHGRGPAGRGEERGAGVELVQGFGADGWVMAVVACVLVEKWVGGGVGESSPSSFPFGTCDFFGVFEF